MHLFDGGWNKLREQIFENQKRLGVIPRKRRRSRPWPTKILKTWDDLHARREEALPAQVEVFAAYAAYSDTRSDASSRRSKTWASSTTRSIIYINGDNRTSAEGGPLGTPNEVAFFNGVAVPVADQLKWYDVWGTEQTYDGMFGGLVLGLRHALHVVQAERIEARRNPAEHGDLLAGAHQGQGRAARAVLPSDRHRAHDPRSCRHFRTRVCRRHQAETHRRHEPRLHVRREERQGPVAAQDSVLRDDGPVGPLQRRLAAEHPGQPRALGGLRRRQPRPAQQPGATSCTTSRRISASRRTSQPNIRTRSRR